MKNYIIDSYLKHIETYNLPPTYNDFKLNGISRSNIRTHFNNLNELHSYINKTYKQEIKKHYCLIDSLTTKFKKTNRYIITCAEAGKKVNKNFLDSLEYYAEQLKAQILIIPIDNPRLGKNQYYDVNLNKHYFVMEELKLNNNIKISNIRINSRIVYPISSLQRLATNNSSIIFGATKVFLEYVVNPHPIDELPQAIMTTGAITENKAEDHKKTSTLSEFDHKFGAVIVEIESKDMYHFRHIEALENGNFNDLGFLYTKDRKTLKNKGHFVFGDIHAGEHDEDVFLTKLRLCRKLNIEDVYVHDFFDGHSISHHEKNNIHVRALRNKEHINSFEREIEEGSKLFKCIIDNIKGNVYRVMGNHDQWYQRYLQEGRYINDPINYKKALKDAYEYLNTGEDPLVKNYKTCLKTVFKAKEKDIERIKWLGVNSIHKIGDINAGQHGHLGLNGSNGSLISIEKTHGKSIVGHAHSAAIFRQVYRVGTTTKLKLIYNDGPSNWTNTGCIAYEDGSRQLINVVNGKYALNDS